MFCLCNSQNIKLEIQHLVCALAIKRIYILSCYVCQKDEDIKIRKKVSPRTFQLYDAEVYGKFYCQFLTSDSGEMCGVFSPPQHNQKLSEFTPQLYFRVRLAHEGAKTLITFPQGELLFHPSGRYRIFQHRKLQVVFFKMNMFPFCLFPFNNTKLPNFRGLETPCVSHDGLRNSWQWLKEKQNIKI